MAADPAREALRRPYARVLERDDDGHYSASILEFPGCYADGATADEAMSQLDLTLTSFIEVMLEEGKPIPEPISSQEFTGRVTLRIPAPLHREASLLAAGMGVSLNRFLSDAVARYVGSLTARGSGKRPNS
jgi:predicted RNase H-like HicB family nuclease